MSRIGVFICKCSGNISDNIDFNKLLNTAKTGQNVTFVQEHDFLCGKEGKDCLGEEIKKAKVDRVLIIACSPKLHSRTFTPVIEGVNINPYLMHMVNIREQCVWMVKDKEKATDKIIRMVMAGISRLNFMEALEEKEIEINPDVMVIGGGISGIEAALTLAKAGRKVHLVEKQPALGGMTPKFEQMYPSGECSPCVLAPLLGDVTQNKNITFYNLTEVKDILGFGGDFTVTLEEKPRYVLPDACISCLECIDQCPVSYRNPYNASLDERKAIDFQVMGSEPKAPYVDTEQCLRFKGEECTVCKDSCTFDAIDYDQEVKEHKIDVGSIVIATGSQVYDAKKVFPEFDFENSNVFTGVEMERILSKTGPFHGKIQLKNGEKPKQIGIIHCVGSRSNKHLPYCSGVCCKYALKQSFTIKSELPDCDITHIYHDLCVEGSKMQTVVDCLQEKEVNFVKWQLTGDGGVDLRQENGTVKVTGLGYNGTSESFVFDMVVLATGFEPNAALSEFTEQLFLTQEESGYLTQMHEKVDSISSISEGVYVIGTANAPKDITSSTVEAKASAGEILAKYIPGQMLPLEPMVAVVDSDACGGCKVCVGLCPYKAISFDEENNVSSVSEVLCKGCGVCVAACPSGAIKGKNFTYDQISNEIKGLLLK